MFFRVLFFVRRHRAEAKNKQNDNSRNERLVDRILLLLLLFSGLAGSAQRVGPERRKSLQNDSIFDPKTVRKSSPEPKNHVGQVFKSQKFTFFGASVPPGGSPGPRAALPRARVASGGPNGRGDLILILVLLGRAALKKGGPGGKQARVRGSNHMEGEVLPSAPAVAVRSQVPGNSSHPEGPWDRPN